MAFDFPNAPTDGQVFVSPGGPTYAWSASSVAWIIKEPAADTGRIKWFAFSTAPVGWLVANGAAISRTTYADLFAAIGAAFGPGDGLTTFNLPDLRGEFVRGLDNGRGVDVGRILGVAQAHEIKSHGHGNLSANGSHAHDPAVSSAYYFVGSDRTFTGDDMTTATGSGAIAFLGNIDINDNPSTDTYAAHIHSLVASGTETRPRNLAFLACIKT